MCKPNDPSIAHFSTWIQQGSPAASHADTLHSTHPRITNHLRVSHRHPGRVRTHLPTTVRPSGPGTGTAAEEKGRRQKQAQTSPRTDGRTHDAVTQQMQRQSAGRHGDPDQNQPNPALLQKSPNLSTRASHSAHPRPRPIQWNKLLFGWLPHIATPEMQRAMQS